MARLERSGRREAVVRFLALGSMLHCHCMWLHNRCSTFRAWLHGEGGSTGEQTAEADEAATMISTTSKPIRSCNIFTTHTHRERQRLTATRVYTQASLHCCAPHCSALFPPAFVQSHSCAEKHSLKQINTLRIVSF